MTPDFDIKQDYKLKFGPFATYLVTVTVRPDSGNFDHNKVMSPEVLDLIAGIAELIEKAPLEARK